jgi:hypothetical protein
LADTAVAITAGSGTNVDTRTESTNSNHRQVVVIGDPSLNAGVAAVKDVSVAPVTATDPALVTVLRPDSPGVITTGSAGTASSSVVTVQGIASMTPILATTTNTALTNFGAGEYETVAASQTAQVLGAAGGTGDYISGLLVVPASTSPGNVLLLDNATSITVFTGGASSVTNLVPFFIPLGMISVSGAWKVTTGANVSVIGIGNFT